MSSTGRPSPGASTRSELSACSIRLIPSERDPAFGSERATRLVGALELPIPQGLARGGDVAVHLGPLGGRERDADGLAQRLDHAVQPGRPLTILLGSGHSGKPRLKAARSGAEG